MRKGLIVATNKKGVIGKDGSIPWYIPEDLKHFSNVTMDNVVIMGRNTWFSLPPKFRPLKNRYNIIVSRKMFDHDEFVVPEGVMIATSLDAAWVTADALVDGHNKTAYVIGGAALYREALPQVDIAIVTQVFKEVEGADTFFPYSDLTHSPDFTRTEESDKRVSVSGIPYQIAEYCRYPDTK